MDTLSNTNTGRVSNTATRNNLFNYGLSSTSFFFFTENIFRVSYDNNHQKHCISTVYLSICDLESRALLHVMSELYELKIYVIDIIILIK